MNTASATHTALPTFDVYTLAPATEAHWCTYQCSRGEEIRAEVTLDEDGQILFAVTARPADVSPALALSMLRSAFRGPKPLGFAMRPGVYRRLRQMLSTGDAWMPRG